MPMIDVFVQMPGASAKEVEERVTRPMEKLLWEIPGVEYVYSTSSPGQSMAIVRFKVGEDEEKSIVRLNQKMSANFDLIPPGATPPLDQAALHRRRPHPRAHALLRPARPVHPAADRRRSSTTRSRPVPDVSEVKIIGGQRRQVRVILDPARMAARGDRPGRARPDAAARPTASCRRASFVAGNREFLVEHRRVPADAPRTWAGVVAGVAGGRPVYLRDVAHDRGRAGGAGRLRLLRAGGRGRRRRATPARHPAVTLSVAKRKGTNAIEIADKVLAKVDGAERDASSRATSA